MALNITRTSQLTGKQHTLQLDVTIEQMQRFDNRLHTGELLQNIFPNLSAGDREFIKSGITPKEWKETFGDME